MSIYVSIIRTKYALEDADPSLNAYKWIDKFTVAYKAMTKLGFNHGDTYENDNKWDQGKASSGIIYTFIKIKPEARRSNNIIENDTYE